MTRRHALPVTLRSLLLLALCSLPFAAAHAQSATATISGTVEDQNGAVVPGVSITIQNKATSLERHATTNDNGQFTVPLLQPGTYTITARHDGFTTAEIRDVVLNVGDQKAFQVQLKTGNINETVNVTAETPLINESVGVGTVVDRKFVENLPLSGRTFQSLVELTPGVVTPRTSFGSQGQFNVNGQRSSSNYFTVDGVSANSGTTDGAGLNQTAAGTLPSTSILGGMNALVSVDALQEFRIQTSSFAPEYGRSAGAQISIITRSGTNQSHGNLFDYLRNDKLDANNWFANSTGKPRPALRQNDFGGTFGGPVFLPRLGEGRRAWYNGRNKTFFFFSYEGLRLRQPQTVVGFSVPSLAARQAAPASLRPFLDAFPLPNGPDLPNGFATENAVFSNPATFDATSIRIDHTIGRTTLFGRYADSPSAAVTRGGSNPLSLVTSLAYRTRSLTIGATSVVSPTIVNEAHWNWTSTNATNSAAFDNFGGAKPLDPSLLFPSYVTPANSKASINITGGVGTLLSAGANNFNSQKQINLLDTVSVTRGRHQLKFGADFRMLRPTAGIPKITLGITFAGVGDPTKSTAQQTAGTFLSGLISSGNITSRPGDVDMQYLNFSGFGQDTWNVSSRLTLTYGVRWDVFPPPTGIHGGLLVAFTSPRDLTTLAFAPAGTPIWKIDYKNIAPRAGIAYRLRNVQNKVLVLRAGAGVFYDIPSGGVLGSQPVNAPNSNLATIPARTPFPFSSAVVSPPPLPAAPPFANAVGVDPDFKTARIYEWNIALEQQLGRFGSASATYVGAVGRRLARATTYITPNSTFGTVILDQSNATSDYHALQLQFQGQLWSNVKAIASYTWSHSIDSTSTDTGSLLLPFTRVTPNSERGSSDYDARHVFSTGLMVTSPKVKNSRWSWLVRNWSLDSIFQARTAFPFDVVITRNLGFGTYIIRPDIDTSKPVYIPDLNAGGRRRLDNTRPTATSNLVGAFIIPTELRQGNLGRGNIRGFGLWQVDSGLRREFALTEGLKLQIKMEMFNIFNHPNFGDPIGLIASVAASGTFTVVPTFGRSQTMLGAGLGNGGANGGLSSLYQVGGPRSSQVSMKLIF